MSIDYPTNQSSVRLLPPLTTNLNTIFIWIGVWLLGVLLFITNFNFGLQGSNQNFSAGGQVIIRLLVCTCCGVYGLIYLRHCAEELIKFPAVWCLLFALWAIFTVPMADNPSYAAASCYALICVTLFTPAVMLQLGSRRVILAIAASMVAYLVASWFTYFFIPSIGRSSFTHPDLSVTYRVGGDAQQLGLHAVWAIGMLLIIGHAKIVRWRWLAPCFALAIMTLPFTQSRTAMVCALAIVCLYLWRTAKRSTLFLGSFGSFAIVSVLFFLIFSGFQDAGEGQLNSALEKVSRSGTTEEIYNLTGRIEIWEYAIDRIAEAPFFGYGHGCARYACSTYKLGGFNVWELHHAHNLLLNVVLCTGLVGGLFLLVMLANQLLKFFTRPDFFPDFVLVVVLIGGITEPVLYGPMPRAHTVLWIIALFWRQMHAKSELAESNDEQLIEENTDQKNITNKTYPPLKRFMSTTTNTPWKVANQSDIRSAARVVLLTNMIPPGELPYYKELASRFAKFTILLSTEMEANRDQAADLTDLDVIVQRSSSFSQKNKHQLGFADRMIVHIPWNTISLLKKLQPDVVITEGLGVRSLLGAYYCKRAKATAHIICANLSEHTEKGRGRLRRSLRRWLLKRVDCVTINGKSGARYIHSLGTKAEDTFHVPYPPVALKINENKFLRFGDDAHRLLFAGRLIELKGMLPFCIALADWAKNNPNRNVELSILGSGPEEAKLTTLTLPSNLKLNFLGRCEHSEIAKHYENAGILAFPSLSDEWGLVVNEAMSAGLPVLGSVYSQAVDELVEEQATGWKFHTDNHDELIAAIDRALNCSVEQLNQMRTIARNKVTPITPAYSADNLVAAVETALQKRRGAK